MGASIPIDIMHNRLYLSPLNLGIPEVAETHGLARGRMNKRRGGITACGT